ncbi:FtsH protease activity modulator HflK [Haliovirga abyssi]|uniref:Protein HflK n=1 Tax=Haliovirga abyssi TaxID=2996794 RepID=A0AAU9DG39_9FUSO|nr:FtsH protease activity modulator HflK [Haliovirga abyssi]BDU50392.1 HflK protein [Haliovirga abyssi]
MAENDLNQNVNNFLKFVKGLGIFGVLIVLGLYLATGIYVVQPDEQAVILRFGKYVETTGPGVHWHTPSPVAAVYKAKTTAVHRIEIGFRTINPGPPARYRDIPEEALMLTGDENILSVDAIVQYKIKDIKQYIFNLKQPYKMLKDAAEASLRQIVGKNLVEEVLTVGKEKIQRETKDRLQEILDKYETGVYVLNVQLQDVQPPKEVIGAFKDVASAKEDKIRYINEANGYRNDMIPKARGEAEKALNDAAAYKSKRINEAQGDVARFTKLYDKYKLGKTVTKTRMYLETMEGILPNVDKIIVDKNLEGKLLNIIGKEGDIK